jgi:diacylglycerol O-acyltransferase / wax synthase
MASTQRATSFVGMQREQLTPLDASFLELEQADDCSHMHIGWAMVFDPLPGGRVPSVDDVRALLDRRLDAMPRFRKRLSHPHTGGLRWPSWEPDPRFDIASHVRHAALPAPAGDAELLDWLADFYSHRLDRRRPLWEITLLDGLAGGKWTLVTKVHHSLVDGVSGVSVTNLILDDSPTPSPLGERAHGAPIAAGGAPSQGGRLLVRGARAGIDLAVHPSHIRTALEHAANLARFIVRDEVVPAPHTSLNVPIGGNRRMTYVAAPLADLKAIKSRLGGSVNDVVLAIAAGGLRHLLQERGAPLPRRGVRVMVPVNVRRATELMALGNRVSSLFVELPVAESDALARYRATMESTAALKRSGIAGGAETLMDVAGAIPPVLHATLARLAFTPRLFNLTITNVPGPQSTLYAMGAPMRRVIPLVPIFANHAVGFAVASYDGEVVIGLNGDHSAMEDLDVLGEGLERALDELREIVGLQRAESLPAEPVEARL